MQLSSRRIIAIIVLIAFQSAMAEFDNVKQPDTTEKINIAVLNLEPRGGLSAHEIMLISDRLRGELINTGKYNVLERAQMDEILMEQKFSLSGACSDAACIVEVGQLLAVHKMVGGSIGKIGEAFSINLKVIDVQSGKIERNIADDVKCSKEELVSFQIKKIARRMAGLVKEKKGYGIEDELAPLGTFSLYCMPLGFLEFGPMVGCEMYFNQNIAIGLHWRYSSLGLLYHYISQADYSYERNLDNNCMSVGIEGKGLIHLHDSRNRVCIGGLLAFDWQSGYVPDYPYGDPEVRWKSRNIILAINGEYRWRMKRMLFVGLGADLGVAMVVWNRKWHTNTSEEIKDSNHISPFVMLDFILGIEFGR